MTMTGGGWERRALQSGGIPDQIGGGQVAPLVSTLLLHNTLLDALRPIPVSFSSRMKEES